MYSTNLNVTRRVVQDGLRGQSPGGGAGVGSAAGLHHRRRLRGGQVSECVSCEPPSASPLLLISVSQECVQLRIISR